MNRNKAICIKDIVQSVGHATFHRFSAVSLTHSLSHSLSLCFSCTCLYEFLCVILCQFWCSVFLLVSTTTTKNLRFNRAEVCKHNENRIYIIIPLIHVLSICNACVCKAFQNFSLLTCFLFSTKKCPETGLSSYTFESSFRIFISLYPAKVTKL